MNVSLIQPRKGARTPLTVCMEPLGIGYVGAVAKRDGHRVRLFDLIADPLPDDAVLARLRGGPPAVVGISGYYQNAPEGLCLARAIKEAFGSRVVLGGVHATAQPETFLNDPSVDAVVLGEGEETFRDLVAAFEAGGAPRLDDVAGLAFRRDGAIVRTAVRPRITDLDALPFPLRDDLPMKRYFMRGFRHPTWRRHVTGSVAASRGCPHNCYFCTSAAMWKRRYVGRSADSIVAELRVLKHAHEVTNVYFVDENLTARRDHALDVLGAVAGAGLGLRFMGMGRVDGIDREVADALAASGFEILLLGVETLHPESAEALNKGFDAARLREVVTLLHRRGILAFASMVIGFPWEDRRDILDTYRRCKRLPLFFFTYHYATPFPGTNLWDDAARDHLLEETDASRFTLSDAVMRTRHLTRRSLRHLRRRIVAGHLASPRYWGRTLRMGLRDPAYFAMLAGAVLHAVAQWLEDLFSFV